MTGARAKSVETAFFGAASTDRDHRRAEDCAAAAMLLALSPPLLGGAVVRGGPGPGRDAWLDLLFALSPASAPKRRAPPYIATEQLLGGLDVATTLASGRAAQSCGVLAEARGGWLVLPSAERLPRATAAVIAAALDAAQDSGDTLGFGVIALDESGAEEEGIASALTDRLALQVDVSRLRPDALTDAATALATDIDAARVLLPTVTAPDEMATALTGVAAALGVASLRAPLLALRAVCAAAALREHMIPSNEDAALAGRLVLAPRATQAPPVDMPIEDASNDEPSLDDAYDGDNDDRDRQMFERTLDDASSSQTPPTPDDERAEARPLEDVVLAAAAASLPIGLSPGPGGASSRATSSAGRAGDMKKSPLRGRPVGSRRGDPRAGTRLDLLATLRAAAPWRKFRQKLPQAARQSHPHPEAQAVAHATLTQAMLNHATLTCGARKNLIVTRDDLRVKRFKQPSETVTIFAVDASGSAAFQRLAEAKGAVELLLGEAYVRRDHVALIAFRGLGVGANEAPSKPYCGAEVLLAPTRSLTRVKRALARLPGGGGTPLASGVDAAMELALWSRRKGWTPTIVLLTDGRANVGRDGRPGRARAAEDALDAAKRLRLAGVAALLIDTAPRAQEAAQALASAMGARYLALPHASSRVVSSAVRALRPSFR